MSARPVEIQILGRTLRFNCPEDEIESFTTAADDLNHRLRGIRDKTNISNMDQLLITAALNLSYDLAEEKLRVGDVEIRRRAELLCQQLDAALNK